MSSGPNKPGQQPKPGPPPGFSAVAPSSQAILLDKLNRRSTPDSEALASSDDEADPHRQDMMPPASQPPRPVRRTSWLNDTSQQQPPQPRKGSFASSSMSPTTSHPSTPAVDAGAATWGTTSSVLGSSVLGRGHTPNTFAWGTGIWTSERKEPPARLTEVLPSPTTAMPPGGPGGFYANDGGMNQTSHAPRDGSGAIPFPIPLHPTPKTYRSQSYSVGQLEPESAATSMGPTPVSGYRRPIPHSGLQHRPSRPSMLSEMANDGSMLGKVNEDEDDDSNDSMQGSMQGNTLGGLQASQIQSVEAKTIEMLTRENAMLRQQQQQQQQQQQYQNLRPRPRASTGATYGLGNGYLQEPVPEESDYAIDEHEEINDGSEMAARRSLARRMSEYSAGGAYGPRYLDSRKSENIKKALWQSSLGFGGLGDISQSRRHSFADVPTRQGSISSMSEAVASQEASSPDISRHQELQTMYSDNGYNPQVSSYFLPGSQQPMAQSYGSQYGSQFANNLSNAFPNRTASPHRNMYGISQPRHNQPLFIVLFKCARADVFYIQEGTGLTVKPGDLVIVEADRGTDLGTVAKDNVDWQQAKDWKEHYAEEQYRWLMMYSQTAAATQEGAGAGLMAASNGLQGSAVGGMGPPSQHHMQEPSSGELKPKLIKRLAQPHEVNALRDKEGNEAKAKRVCMQKVKEHGLNMEILDAEFQMDWKKLTFYYFADSYINFNSLVTDLFKIYKTRIWMSAINPASFASPTLGLQAPSGIGPGAVGASRGATAGERRPNVQQEPPAAFAAASQAGRGGPPPAFPGPYPSDRPAVPAAAYPAPSYAHNPYGAFGNVARPGAMPYPASMMPGMDAYSGGFPQGGEYGGRGRFPAPQGTAPGQQNVPTLGTQADWSGAFQGLSLNSR